MSDSRTSKASDSWFTTLDEFALLRVGGDDAPGFLQGQLSNDIHALDAPGETEGRRVAAQLSCFSSARGRVLSCLLVVRDDRDYLLLLPSALAAPIASRLQLYVLRSRVTIAQEEVLVPVGIAGADLLARIAPALGERPWSSARLGELPGTGPALERDALVVRMPDGPGPRGLLLMPRGASPAALPAQRADMADWWRSEIRAAVPWVLPQTEEKFVAQMLNLDLLGGLSFSKGCFTGQEVIARTHYLGRIKRRLRRFAFTGGEAQALRDLQPGDDVVTAAGRQTVGAVVLASLDAPPADGASPGGELLAVIQQDLAGEEALVLARGDAALTPLPMPEPIAPLAEP